MITSDNIWAEVIKNTLISRCESMKKSKLIEDYKVEINEVNEKEILYNLYITPNESPKRINTSFTITKDGCEFKV